MLYFCVSIQNSGAVTLLSKEVIMVTRKHLAVAKMYKIVTYF